MDDMETLLLTLGLSALEAGISALASSGKPIPPRYLELRKEARKRLVELAGEEASPEELEPGPTPEPASDGESGLEDTGTSEPEAEDPSDGESRFTGEDASPDGGDTSMQDNPVK